MPELSDDPFRAARAECDRMAQTTPVIIVDFHAEATSEKIALGWYLDGHCSAVLGTHTHVQTSDERVLPGGTAYITDVGMTGPRDGVIGMDRERILERFLTQLPVRFEVATGPAQLNAVVVDVDEESGRARSISRIAEVERASAD
jgi:metallophosphoesterase (TIGR00282 family)